MSKGETVPTDEELIDAFQKGDPEGFRRIVRRYERVIYGFAFRMSGNHADADDLSQEIFLRVYLNLEKFRREASFRTWLFRIARSRGADFRRKAALDRLRRGFRQPEGAGPGGPAPDPPLPGEGKPGLGEAVRSLPGRQRDTLILKYFQGLKFREIAEVMGCSEGTAKANLFHAIRSLRARLRVEKRSGTAATLDLP